MKKESESKPSTQGSHHVTKPSMNPGFAGRFACGTGPDEESDCFQNAVSGLLKRGGSEWKAKKAVEACFRALAKL